MSKLTLQDILSKQEAQAKKISIHEELIASLEKVLSLGVEKAVKEFREEAEEAKETILADLKGQVNEAVNYAKSIKPIKGDSYILTETDKKEIATKVKVPIVEKVIEKTEIIKEMPVITNEIKEVAIKDDGKEIVDKINQTPLEPQHKIRAEHIIGLPDTSNFIKKQGYHGGGDITMSYTLTGLNGVLKSFTIPENRRVNFAVSSSAPFIIPSSDITLSGTRNTTLTFGANVDASITLKDGDTVVVEYII